MKPFFASALLAFAFVSSSLPGLAETSGPIPADVLEQLGAEGWKEVAPGVMQRSLETGRVETLGVGAEGQRFRLAELQKHLAFLRAEYQRHPSPDLRKTIRSQRAEVLRTQAGLTAGAADKLMPSFEKIFASGTNCGANYNGTADAFAKSPGAGVTANAFFRSDCGDEGEVYVTTIARASSADGTVTTVTRNDPTTAPNTPRFGSDTTASASISVSGVQNCYSYGYSSVTSYDPIITYAVSDTNNLCVSVPNPSEVLISEFRFRGPNGMNDEFVELYNNTDSTVYVGVADGSAGWALVASDGVSRFVVPNGTVIPPRGHYLATNVTYSLGGNASGNVSYSADIPSGGGIALFRTANSLNFNLANRLDAAGYSTVDPLYREGTGLPAGGAETSSDLEYSFLRSLANVNPKDTNDNVADFLGVHAGGTTLGTGQRLGAPGPENLASPTQNWNLTATLIDSGACQTCPPNRLRDTTPTPAHPAGTMTIRRRFTNNTGRTITRLRFRIANITTLYAPAGIADLRVLSSTDTPVTRTDGTTVIVKGTTLELPPAQSLGGGWNSSLTISPQGLAPGASVDVQFVLGLVQSGTFRFYFNTETD